LRRPWLSTSLPVARSARDTGDRRHWRQEILVAVDTGGKNHR
jgi:hypothetical protein